MTVGALPGYAVSRRPSDVASSRAQIKTGGLVWSEYCYLICIAVALTLCVMPQDWVFPGKRALRHFPLMATMPLVVLSVIGFYLSSPPTQRQRSSRTVLSVLAPLLIVGVWALIGSSHARFVQGYQATFLNLGLYIAAAPCAAMMMVCSRSPVNLARAYMKLLACSAVAMCIGLVLVYGRAELYHEQIFLLIPLAVTSAIALRQRSYAWFASMCFLGAALLSQKNTSYLIALLTVLYIAVFLWLTRIERTSSVKRLWAHYLAFVCVVAMAAFAFYLIYFRDRYLPSGNVEFRSFTYRAAWNQFIESPLWGTSFSAESIREFTLYTIGIARNRLPTHSDVMDLLANGGLIAAALWIWAYLRAGAFAYKRVLAPSFLHYPWAAQAHTFALITLSVIVVYAFNPILLQPEMSYLTWTTFGFLVGLAASCDPELHAGQVARKLYAERDAAAGLRNARASSGFKPHGGGSA